MAFAEDRDVLFTGDPYHDERVRRAEGVPNTPTAHGSRPEQRPKPPRSSPNPLPAAVAPQPGRGAAGRSAAARPFSTMDGTGRAAAAAQLPPPPPAPPQHLRPDEKPTGKELRVIRTLVPVVV